MTADPPFDLSSLTTWLETRVSVARPLEAAIIDGGRSNLTFGLTDATGRRFVLRRPPMRGVVASAHDVGRESRILSALGGSLIPVPEVVGEEADEAVIGAPFYVMRFVDGAVVRTEHQATTHLTPDARRSVAGNVADTLADLHAIRPGDVGLGELGRTTGYVDRQLRRWGGQLDEEDPNERLLARVHDELSATVPPQRESAIVHGDYRIDNLILDPGTGAIRAVLDWELATLGDPRADLGLLIVYWSEVGDRIRPLGDTPTAVPGFGGRDQILERYTTRRGREEPDLEYFITFAYWRLGCILAGVLRRYRQGVYGDKNAPLLASLAEAVPALAEEARERILRTSRH